MLLGKRSRHPIKRTTSMTGITVDVSNLEDDVVQEPILSDDPQNPLHEFPNPNLLGYDQRLMAMVSPRIPAAAAAAGRSGLVHAAPFLRSCCLCKRRLAPGRDIYMYRGNTAFCSLECREEQMKQDERSEKLNGIAGGSKKEDRRGSSSTTSNSKASEPVAAA